MASTVRKQSIDSYLNDEYKHYAEEALKLGIKRDIHQRKLIDLYEKINDLENQISNCKKTLREVRQLEADAQEYVRKEKEALSKVCRLINKHDFHYDFDHPAYIESDETLEIENKEVYIDTWQDALDRCNQLTENNS